MAIKTDLSRSPYFDDYNEYKNFYKVLYRPGVPVQTRELNQMQTILQDQINKFGRHIFKEGTIVEGCSFTFDKNYSYVKIKDNFANNSAITKIEDFIGDNIYNSNGLTATIVNAVPGFESDGQALNTLYVKYKNSVTLEDGSAQSIFTQGETLSINLAVSANTPVGNVVVSKITTALGKGYAFTTTKGVIFQKGFFINVPDQTLIVSKYDNQPDNISVGFNSLESIVTPEADTSLLDNAAGAPNYTAPGAHRFRLTPTLITRTTTDVDASDTFFSIVDFQLGVPITIRDTAEYAALGANLAKRTFETNGNFVIRPFFLSSEEKSTTDPLYSTHLNIISSRGLGYVEGYRVEYLNNNKVSLRKGTDVETFNQRVSMNYGNYYYAKELVGDFNQENIQLVELHSVPKAAITSGGFLSGVSAAYDSTNKIGTANLKMVVWNQGSIGVGSPDAVYRLYLYNVRMLPGKNPADVRSVIRYDGSVKAVADVILEYNFAANKDIAVLKDQKLNNSIYPFGQSAVKADGFSDISYTYRRASVTEFSALDGSAQFSLPTPIGSATEEFYHGGVIPAYLTPTFVVLPTTTVTSTDKNGSVALNGTTSVYGNGSTTFLSDYAVGNYISVNNETRCIVRIESNHLMIVNSAFATTTGATTYSYTHAKIFPKGVQISFVDARRHIEIVGGDTAYFYLNEQLTSAVTCKIYYDVTRSNAAPIKKQYFRNAFVKIDCQTHPMGATGPWSLGLPDVAKINAIYVGTNHIYDYNGEDKKSAFRLLPNRTDNAYNLSTLSTTSGTVDSKSTILIDLDVYTIVNDGFNGRSQGIGFFTANSYPVNDSVVAVDPGPSTITTAEIPVHISTDNVRFDMRDCVDFRVYSTNTAVITSSYLLANVNPSAVDSVNNLSGGTYSPSPDTEWRSYIEHYLPRKDLIAIDINGKLQVIEGKPGNTPVSPPEKSKTMTLGVVDVSPYPTFSSKQASSYGRYDYAVKTSISQNRRYTMKDVGGLDLRINNLEYYTSLTLLEKNTNDLLVKNETTGLNRFKNGILVDPFRDHSIGDTTNPALRYKISIDTNNHLRPYYQQFKKTFELDFSASTNIVKKGSLVMLDYNHNKFISQTYASKYRNCADGNVYLWSCEITLTPSGINEPDLHTKPDTPALLDLSQNWINLAQGFGTQFGDWETVKKYDPVTVVGSKVLTDTQTDDQGNVVKQFNTAVTTTTTTAQKRVATTASLDTKVPDIQIDLGTFVQSVSQLTYIPTADITFSAYGMKPGARVYAFFDDKDVNQYCRPYNLASTNFGDWAYITNWVGNWGDPLIVDSQGRIIGWFQIPANTFKSSELKFMLVDISDLAQGASAISTKGVGIFYANKIHVEAAKADFNTRIPALSFSNVDQLRDVVDSKVENTPSTQVIINPATINSLKDKITKLESTTADLTFQIEEDILNIKQLKEYITVVEKKIPAPYIAPPPYIPYVAPYVGDQGCDAGPSGTGTGTGGTGTSCGCSGTGGGSGGDP